MLIVLPSSSVVRDQALPRELYGHEDSKSVWGLEWREIQIWAWHRLFNNLAVRRISLIRPPTAQPHPKIGWPNPLRTALPPHLFTLPRVKRPLHAHYDIPHRTEREGGTAILSIVLMFHVVVSHGETILHNLRCPIQACILVHHHASLTAVSLTCLFEKEAAIRNGCGTVTGDRA